MSDTDNLIDRLRRKYDFFARVKHDGEHETMILLREAADALEAAQPVTPDREVAYEAVRHSGLLTSSATVNALIWRAVHCALEAGEPPVEEPSASLEEAFFPGLTDALDALSIRKESER